MSLLHAADCESRSCSAITRGCWYRRTIMCGMSRMGGAVRESEIVRPSIFQLKRKPTRRTYP